MQQKIKIELPKIKQKFKAAYALFATRVELVSCKLKKKKKRFYIGDNTH